MASEMLAHPQIYAVVAEIAGRVVGCNFLDERSAIVGVGPVGVDPVVQNRGVGRALMLDVLRRAADSRAAGVRLLQSAYHSRSLSLYASLGFTARDVLACMNGTPPTGRIPGRQVRPAPRRTSRPVPPLAAVSTGTTAPRSWPTRSPSEPAWSSSTTAGSAATRATWVSPATPWVRATPTSRR